MDGNRAPAPQITMSRTPLVAAREDSQVPATAKKMSKVQRVGISFEPSYPLGQLIAWSALLLYHGVNMLLLLSHCAERGCFRAQCRTKPDTGNQCFPPLSDTYIIYDATLPAYSRRVFILIAAAVRSVVIPCLVTASHHLLAQHGKLCCGALRTLALALIMIAQAIFDMLSIIFWNDGPSGQLHKVLSSILILHWLIGVLPVWNFALMGSPGMRCGACINWGLWIFAWADVVWLRMTVSTCHSWIWYAFEWLVILTQGTSVMAGGLALPRSFQLRRPGHDRPWWLPSWVLVPIIVEEDAQDFSVPTIEDPDGL